MPRARDLRALRSNHWQQTTWASTSVSVSTFRGKSRHTDTNMQGPRTQTQSISDLSNVRLLPGTRPQSMPTALKLPPQQSHITLKGAGGGTGRWWTSLLEERDSSPPSSTSPWISRDMLAHADTVVQPLQSKLLPCIASNSACLSPVAPFHGQQLPCPSQKASSARKLSISIPKHTKAGISHCGEHPSGRQGFIDIPIPLARSLSQQYVLQNCGYCHQ